LLGIQIDSEAYGGTHLIDRYAFTDSEDLIIRLHVVDGAQGDGDG
jgi:hypothetical protein